MSPVGAIVLQWHTKVKYMTELPLVYTLGYMAVDKRAFNKLNEGDQAIVREVMAETYKNFDKVNLEDNREARDALLNAGIVSVDIDQEEYQRVRDALADSTASLGRQGMFSQELYEEMLVYIDEYRSEHSAD